MTFINVELNYKLQCVSALYMGKKPKNSTKEKKTEKNYRGPDRTKNAGVYTAIYRASVGYRFHMYADC